MNQEKEDNYRMLEERVITCPCGGANFAITLTNGTDGHTNSIFLKCAKCHASRAMRRIMKSLDHA